MKKRCIAAMLVLVLVAGLLAGCSNPSVQEPASQAASSGDTAPAGTEESDASAEGVTITFMPTQAGFIDHFDGVFSDKIIPDFEAETGIKVDVQVVPDTSNEMVKLKLATGEAPELWSQNVPQMVQAFNATENCVVLDDQPWVERLSNPDLLRYEGDGHIYGMPLTSAQFFPAAYYNKGVLEEIGIVDPQPTTYQEFLDLCQQIKDAGVVPVYMTDKDAWTTQMFTTNGLGVVMEGQDDVWDKLLTNEQKFADVPEFTKLLQDFMKLYELGYVNEDHMSQPYDSLAGAMASGKYAMCINSESAISDINTKYPDVEMGAMVIPVSDKMILGIGNFVHGIYVGKDSPHPEEALMFLEYLSRPEVYSLMMEEKGGFSPFTDVESSNVQPCVQKLVDEYVNTGKYTYEFDSHLDACRAILDSGLFRLFQEMVMGEKTPEEVWIEWDEQFSAFMKEKEYPGF